MIFIPGVARDGRISLRTAGKTMAAQVNGVSSLYLAYPCSVDAGVDPVEYTNMIIRRIEDKEKRGDKPAAETLRKELDRILSGCSNNEERVANAKKLRDSWGHAVHEDKTMMEDDMNEVAERSEKMGLLQHGINTPVEVNDEFLEPVRVIDEFLDEHIHDIQAFLKCISNPQNGTTRFLYLCGHGLSEEVATELRGNLADDVTKKSRVWPWELCSCEETMNRLPSDITGKAQKGDIVVFSSGLLTPEWVMEKLQEYEKDPNKVENTIIIVIDACYSGTWITRIQECLTKQPLEYTRVIVQTSCGEDEVSYGHCFTPVFCALQDTGKRTELEGLYEKDKDAMEEIGLFHEQTPIIYDSQKNPKFPNSFYFIDDVEFFNFCRKYFTIQNRDTSRSIPPEEYSDFFASFSSDHPPKIHCFRLNRMKKNDSPLAFFLIEWEKKKYHIHLHFDNFKYMRLTGITHVDVANGTKYPCTEDRKDTKICITKNDMSAWYKYVDRNQTQIVDHFKKFAKAHKMEWNNKSSWNMNEALPDDLIRSRSAYFQEAKRKCTPMAELKILFKQ